MQLLTFWQGKCQWMSIEQNTWHDSLYILFCLLGRKDRNIVNVFLLFCLMANIVIPLWYYPALDIQVHTRCPDLISPPRPLFWAQLRLSETQSDIFILKACLFSDSDNHQSDQTSNNNKIINVDHDIMKKARCVFINFEFLIKLLVRFAELLAAAE